MFNIIECEEADQVINRRMKKAKEETLKIKRMKANEKKIISSFSLKTYKYNRVGNQKAK